MIGICSSVLPKRTLGHVNCAEHTGFGGAILYTPVIICMHTHKTSSETGGHGPETQSLGAWTESELLFEQKAPGAVLPSLESEARRVYVGNEE